MESIYKDILESVSTGKKMLAVLVDPDKAKLDDVPRFIEVLNNSTATHIFIGGSTVESHATEILVSEIKKYTKLPVVLFPGDVEQITNHADAILFLSLISGRNPEYLIGQHVAAVGKLKDINLEVIPTGYILIESGKKTAVQRVTETEPMLSKHIDKIIDTANAGELLGMKLIYLEAGSGALNVVSSKVINAVKHRINIPLIVGGGIRSKIQIEQAYSSGADVVVIGTAFEDDITFFEQLKK